MTDRPAVDDASGGWESGSLADRERRFRALIEHASDIVTVLREDGTIVYESPTVERLLGFTPEECVGQHVFEWIHPDDRDTMHALFRMKIDSAVTPRVSIPYRVQDRHGDWHWFESMVVNLLDDPVVRGLVVYSREVSQRIGVEAVLRERDRQYRRIVETASEGIWMTDAAGVITYVNEQSARMLGYRPEEMVGKPLEAFVPEADYPQLREMLDRRRRGITERYDARRRHRDGQEVWVLVSATPLRNEAGEYQGSLAMLTDITERKRAEQLNSAFRSLGQQLNSASTPREAAHIVLEVADRLLGWDCCWVELLETRSQRCSVVASFDLIHGVRTDVTPTHTGTTPRPLTRRVVENGATLILRDPNDLPAPGATFFGDVRRPSVSLLGVPIRNGNHVVGVLSIQSYQPHAYSPQDVETLQALADYCAGALERTQGEAARHELQEQLVQARKMEAIGRLAGGVAHDFNNMLGVINGYSEILLTRHDLPASARSSIEEILRAGTRAAGLTRQLLAFSRKQIVQPQVLDLGEEVRGVQKMLRRIIGEDIELVTSVRGQVWKIEADASQVEQVLLNLAANARDAMPQGGTLTIRVENERLTARRARDGEPVLPGEYVCLSVSDTGTGIDVDILDHVFEPFFTTKEVGQGTGLGLATVYGIIKQSGGHIDVESELDCGTTFRLYFPRYAEAEPEPEPPEEPKPMFRGGDETVLVVEDEEMLRRMVCTGLRANGYRVLEARNADEALQCCQEHSGNIQLLLTDVIMPGRSGSQLAALAAAEHPGIKVMFMSGYTDSAIVHHGIRSAEVHFLPKPFNLTTLMQKVREVLESA